MPIPETWYQFRNLILEWVLPEWIPMYWNSSSFEFESTSWLETQVEFFHGTLTVRWSLQSCNKELLQNVCTIWIHGCTWHCKQQSSSITIMQVQRTIRSYDPETQQRIGVVQKLLQKKLPFSIFLILIVESLNSLLEESWSRNVVCNCKSPVAHTTVAANYSLVGRTNTSSKSPVASFSSSYHPWTLNPSSLLLLLLLLPESQKRVAPSS